MKKEKARMYYKFRITLELKNRLIMSSEREKMRWMKSAFLGSIFIATLLTIALHQTDNLHLVDTFGFILEDEHAHKLILEDQHPQKQNPKQDDRCDLFSGTWVFDNANYPLYEETKCSFMKNDFACQKFGRNNLKYQQWAWKPHNCQLPRFDGRKFMEKIRGKRVVFVGDSLNRNQWTSLLCLIESSLHQSSNKSVVRKDNLFAFYATEYNATIEFYWSPLLVESNGDDPYDHYTGNNLMLRINSIEKHARHWNDADILIFDNFTWWVHKYNVTLVWGSLGSREAISKVVSKDVRNYEMCMNTWSDWLEININRTKTKLFFMSLSPFHHNGEHFDGHTCYNETEPVLKEDYWGVQTDREMMRIAESTIHRLERRGLHVRYLNITHLSDYRRDAHISICRNLSYLKNRDSLINNPKQYADCVHWCLPGVPDVWNIILYHYIINS